MLSDRNTRASIFCPTGRGDPSLYQNSFRFLEHPEIYSQDLVSFQYTLCSSFIILATVMVLFLENSIIFQ
jgi:heme/copper-type cytochrome/quinol oxidase subunit 1